MKYMLDQVHMESSWAYPNHEEDYQDIVEGVNNQECGCLLWIENN